MFTNEEVAEILDVEIEDVEALGDELGVADDTWTDGDIDEARELLEEDEEDDDD